LDARGALGAAVCWTLCSAVGAAICSAVSATVAAHTEASCVGSSVSASILNTWDPICTTVSWPLEAGATLIGTLR
jgi:hypothetical protein